MGLKGKLTAQIEMRAGGDVFHELFRFTPHQIPKMSPTTIQGCDLHQGEWGTVGSVIIWNYTHDGKPKVAKEVIEAIDGKREYEKLKDDVEDPLTLLGVCIKLTKDIESHHLKTT
ncbi:MLP-like protein [Abeliophyllum distichum]|uniref:MLP-like protein n=1 Tax=Abeliophyllum distichum TaxID=126358 RepID=A0ABD1SGZ0_9LAMI